MGKPAYAPQAIAPAPAQEDVTDEIRKLAALRDDEFAAKKTQLLGL